MKKNKDEKKQGNSRRLTLSRETVRVLQDPALLKLAGGEFYADEAMFPTLQTKSMTGC